MLVQVSADRRSASVVSIPRDSWVEIPGRGRAKVIPAYSWGGPALLVGTLEELTGVRVDHLAVIDFVGFRSVVDAIGGVDVGVAAPTSSAGAAFHAGVNHLDGDAALVDVRQRHELAGGDLARAARRQNVLRAVLGRLVDVDVFRRLAFLAARTRSVSVDATLTNSGLRLLGVRRAPAAGRVPHRTGAGRGLRGRPVGGARRRRPGRDAVGGAAERHPAAYAQQHPDALLGPAPA